MFLVRETLPSNKLCSYPSRAQLEFFEMNVTYFKKMVSLKGLLHMFKTWCDFEKRQLIQLSFW